MIIAIICRAIQVRNGTNLFPLHYSEAEWYILRIEQAYVGRFLRVKLGERGILFFVALLIPHFQILISPNRTPFFEFVRDIE